MSDQDVKEAAAAGGNASPGAAVNESGTTTKETRKDLQATMKDLRPGEKAKEALRWYVHLEEKGTPLRPIFKSARESLNDAVARVDQFLETGKAHASAAIHNLEPDISWMGKEVGTVDDFARTHRELTVGAIGLAVALPSALGGARRAVINGVVAATGAAAMFAMSDFFERQEKKKEGVRKAGEGSKG
ncbi:hypothetical protein Naga_100071g3 [Nannochloropsis gaditana]|uniref:Uncharacterized protein n=1 Tax=Nannochloropsis gaditana TaxID=72520 RepID=W7U8A8_9STRA|nr:hypothetical protein Naga_100071g3 [Nannochloropsis gaditana]